MLISGLVLMDNVKWLSFHSGYDFGYLVKLELATVAFQNCWTYCTVAFLIGFVTNFTFKFWSKFLFLHLQLNLVTNQDLSKTEDEFFELLELYFPCIYDIKYLMKSCKNLKGGLQVIRSESFVIFVLSRIWRFKEDLKWSSFIRDMFKVISVEFLPRYAIGP